MGEKGESTHMWQDINRGIGKLIKSLTEEEQGLWIQASRAHVEEWNTQRMSCSRLRIIMTQWVGAAFRKYLAKYQKSHERFCKMSVLLVALDDFDLDEI